MPWRSPYRPVYVVRMSSAVWAISGVWLLDRNVPLSSKKFKRLGISCRSDGTFGLSLKKCTLSKVICTTCLTPLPSWHPLVVLPTSMAVLTGGDDAAARTGEVAAAVPNPAISVAAPISAVIRPSDPDLLSRFMWVSFRANNERVTLRNECPLSDYSANFQL